MFKITFWQTICNGGKSIDHPAVSSSNLVPKIFWLSGKHFHSLLQCDACLEILFRQFCENIAGKFYWFAEIKFKMGSGGKEKKGDVTVEGEAAPEGPSYEEKLRWFLLLCTSTSLCSWNEERRDYPCPAFKPAASDSFRWSPNRWPVRSWQRKSTRCALLWLTIDFIRTLDKCRCHNFIFYPKVIKKGSKHKGFVRNGLKDVQVRSQLLFSQMMVNVLHNTFLFSFWSLFEWTENCWMHVFLIGTNSQRGNWSCDICWRCHSHWGLFRWALVGFWIFFL